MKKLALFLVVLISLTVIAGCQSSRKKVTRFTTDESVSVETTEDSESTTTITKLEEDEKVDMEPIEIPSDNEEGVEFAVTTLEKNTSQNDKGYHLVQGTTPKSTDKIVVNNYPLNKYQAGSTEWSYIAAISLGTLKKGENHFSIRAFDKDNKVIGSKSFTITYKGIESGALIDTGVSLNLSIMLTIAGLIGFYRIRRRSES